MFTAVDYNALWSEFDLMYTVRLSFCLQEFATDMLTNCGNSQETTSHQDELNFLPPAQSWSVLFPGPAGWLALISILSVFRCEIVHLLHQVGQLDQTLLQVLLQLGHLQLQGQDSLTEHTDTVSGQTDIGWQDNISACVTKTCCRSRTAADFFSARYPCQCWVQAQICGDAGEAEFCV